jgi:hypothetical protein
VNTFIASTLELDIPAEVISGFTGVWNDSRIRNIRTEMARKEMRKFSHR